MRFGQPPDRQRLRGKRDRALLALLLACGLRRHEAVALTLDHGQQREEHWAMVDLVGKGGHVRTVPVPDWVRTELDDRRGEVGGPRSTTLCRMRHRRRTCARLCHASGGELEQIQFLLGHVSVQLPNATLAASNEFDQPSTIALASNRTLDVAAPVVEGLPTFGSYRSRRRSTDGKIRVAF